MDNTILVVPTWASNIVHFAERNWIAIVGIAIIALLACIITELAKHKWAVKYEEDKAKAIVRWVLVAVTAGFTTIGTIIYFVQTNGMSLSKVPYIGQNEVEVLGAAWTLYNFRLNKTFKNIQAKAAKWSAAKVQPIATPADNLVAPIQAPAPPATEFSIEG